MKRKFLKYKKSLVFISMGLFIIYITNIAPGSLFSVVLFYILLLFFLFMLLSLYFAAYKSLRIALSIILILILRQLAQLNLLNILTILAINILLEVYFKKRKPY